MISKIIFQTSKINIPDHKIKMVLEKIPPLWTYKYFRDTDMLNFFNENHTDEFPNIVNKFKLYNDAHKIDLFKYYFLYICGGVYIDSDVILNDAVENIIKDYSFFSVNSNSSPESIFNGVIGSSPKNKIIYKALIDAYNINQNKLTDDSDILPKNLFTIVNNETYDFKYKLYDEHYYDSEISKCMNDKNIVLFYYWKNKIVSEDVTERVYLGASETNTKMLKLNNNYSNDECIFVINAHNYCDKFDTHIINNELSIERIDINSGWKYDHFGVIKYNYLKYIRVYEFDTNKKIRLGALSDGGYVIGDINDDINYDCYISAGVSDEESFTRDFLKKYNMNEFNSYAFDGTIKNYPYNYTTNISFVQKNISDHNDDKHTNLLQLINKHSNIFLKMDIEGHEFKWLSSMSTDNLNKIKQMVFEFHGINDNTWGVLHSDKIKCFEKISKTHYLIHAHGNNNCYTTNKIPDVIEFTYLRKDMFNNEPQLNNISLPIKKLDYPGRQDFPDHDLSFYPFTNL